MAVNHVQQESSSLTLSTASQIGPNPDKHHPRGNSHEVETQQAMVHSVEGLWKVRIHSINLVSIFNFVNDKNRKLYQVGDSGTVLHDFQSRIALIFIMALFDLLSQKLPLNTILPR
jgi:hypothetical protein